jgi:hypothetical protein
MTHARATSDARNRGGEESLTDHQSYPTFVQDVLGLIGIAVFIAVMVALAAGVTWLVVKVSPSPEKKRQRAALKQQN